MLLVPGKSGEGENLVGRRAQAQQLRAIKEARMTGQEPIQLRQLADQVDCRTPRQTARRVNVDLLGREPFDTVGKSEAATHAGQRAKLIAQQRPLAPLRREAIVVVGFAVVDEQADAPTFFPGVIQIAVQFGGRKVLENLRVGPLQAAFGQPNCRVVPAAAQAFEQKDRFGKFIAHAGGDVLPDEHRHLVARIAPEAIDTAAAPGEKDFRQLFPQRGAGRINLDEIFPDRAPRARADKLSGRILHEPFRMLLKQGRAPAGVVDH